MFNLTQFSATSSPGPLAHVRVIDLSRLVAGNTLTMMLADMGADVIKVEPPTGDTLREWKVSGISTAWKTYSRNKRSLSLDFRNPQAKTILLKLASTANVLVESFRPGTLRNWNCHLRSSSKKIGILSSPGFPVGARMGPMLTAQALARLSKDFWIRLYERIS